MTFPAYQAFAAEHAQDRALWRVYMALQPPELDFVVAKDIKADSLGRRIRMGRVRVAAAIDKLVASDYLIEDSRDARGVRKLRLVFARPKLQPNGRS